MQKKFYRLELSMERDLGGKYVLKPEQLVIIYSSETVILWHYSPLGRILETSDSCLLPQPLSPLALCLLWPFSALRHRATKTPRLIR